MYYLIYSYIHIEYAEITSAKLCPWNILGCDLKAKTTKLPVSNYHVLVIFIQMENAYTVRSKPTCLSLIVIVHMLS